MNSSKTCLIYPPHVSLIPLNNQVLLCDGNVKCFEDRALIVLQSYHIQHFILKLGDYVHYQTPPKELKLRLNNMFCNAWMYYTRKHVTLKFTQYHMNAIMVETWKDLKLSFTSIPKDEYKAHAS